ncbi:kinase-like domain-containing protein [Glomus cerebriforme]|uniref:Kinase-like domain-containing protein n=1 Tax=Glomus cerebriforme TaxID=658196 RepID=A0A397SW17_9GLOM|nr:kinase-like domain-containing protein [Glomus cerebriforme]
MAETANQLLAHVVPDCAWIPLRQRGSSIPAYPPFPQVVRQWRFFSRSVNGHIININNIPGGQFTVFPTETISLGVEEDAKTRLYTNVLMPVNALLRTQGAVFRATCGLLGSPDHILCTNNSTVAKMPVEMKTRHNLNLRDHDLWEIYRHADRVPIMEADPNFRFKKRILSQVFGEMACNGFHYGILSNYTDTYFLQRPETEPTTLYTSHVIHHNSVNPTLRECVYYISHLAINDQVGRRLGRVLEDLNSSNDDSSDDDVADDSNNNFDDDYVPSDNDDSDNDYSSKKRKSSSKQIGSRKRVTASTASSSKGITTIGEYIGGGTFGKVFSGYYNNQAVAWKTCDTYKKKEEMKTLKHEAHVYSILRECQGHAIPHLHYKGYIYGGFLFALALQLIEDAHHVDPKSLAKEEKKLIVNQLKSIHNCGVLHNDISEHNILYEPKNRHYFFIDFGLSEIVGSESPKLRQEERRLKRFLQL